MMAEIADRAYSRLCEVLRDETIQSIISVALRLQLVKKNN